MDLVHLAASVSGLVTIGLCILLYEDEEKRIASVLSDLWVRLDAARRPTLEVHTSILREICTLLGKMFSRVVGSGSLSGRALWVAMMLTIGSMDALGDVAYFAFLRYHHELGRPYVYVGYSILNVGLYTGLALVPFLTGWAHNNSRRMLLVLAVPVACGFILPETSTVLYRLKLYSMENPGGSLFYDLSLPVIAGMAFDLLMIAIFRYCLARTQSSSSFGAILWTSAPFAVCLLVVAGPWKVVLNGHHSMSLIRFEDSNAASALLAALVFLCGASLLVHYAAWPAVQRVVYALQRWPQCRKYIVALGTSLILYGVGDGGLWTILQRKVFGS